MSAILRLQPRTHSRIVPRLWATAAPSSIASAAEAVQQQRKRPHCVRLLQAAAEPAPLAPVVEFPRRQRQPEATVALYRPYTEAMLRRYVTLSLEQGRVSSLLGRELFRGNVTHCSVQAFDDVVIFVHDVGNCLAQLEPGARYLLRRIALEGHNQEEAAALTGLSLRTVIRRYNEGLDQLAKLLLDRNLMRPVVADGQDPACGKTCQ